MGVAWYFLDEKKRERERETKEEKEAFTLVVGDGAISTTPRFVN